MGEMLREKNRDFGTLLTFIFAGIPPELQMKLSFYFVVSLHYVYVCSLCFSVIVFNKVYYKMCSCETFVTAEYPMLKFHIIL